MVTLKRQQKMIKNTVQHPKRIAPNIRILYFLSKLHLRTFHQDMQFSTRSIWKTVSMVTL